MTAASNKADLATSIGCCAPSPPPSITFHDGLSIVPPACSGRCIPTVADEPAVTATVASGTRNLDPGPDASSPFRPVVPPAVPTLRLLLTLFLTQRKRGCLPTVNIQDAFSQSANTPGPEARKVRRSAGAS